jgi:hypothetical protein
MFTKSNKSDEWRTKIAAVAATISAEEQAIFEEILAKARAGGSQSETREIPKTVCAKFFLEHNPFNRDWQVERSEELLRRLETGLWQFNNASIGFYLDGGVGDGQHRLAAAALYSHPFLFNIVYGMARAAVSTVDDGWQRHGSDAAKLDGVENAKRKEQIIKSADSYMKKAGCSNGTSIRSISELKNEIKKRDSLLNIAIEAGTEVRNGIAGGGALKETPTQTISYLLLLGGWPLGRVTDRLRMLVQGISVDGQGENSPLFVASDLITKSHTATDKRNKLTGAKELGMAIGALVEAEKGTKAMLPKSLREMVKKGLPAPTYPTI